MQRRSNPSNRPSPDLLHSSSGHQSRFDVQSKTKNLIPASERCTVTYGKRLRDCFSNESNKKTKYCDEKKSDKIDSVIEHSKRKVLSPLKNSNNSLDCAAETTTKSMLIKSLGQKINCNSFSKPGETNLSRPISAKLDTHPTVKAFMTINEELNTSFTDSLKSDISFTVLDECDISAISSEDENNNTTVLERDNSIVSSGNLMKTDVQRYVKQSDNDTDSLDSTQSDKDDTLVDDLADNEYERLVSEIDSVINETICEESQTSDSNSDTLEESEKPNDADLHEGRFFCELGESNPFPSEVVDAVKSDVHIEDEVDEELCNLSHCLGTDSEIKVTDETGTCYDSDIAIDVDEVEEKDDAIDISECASEPELSQNLLSDIQNLSDDNVSNSTDCDKSEILMNSKDIAIDITEVSTVHKSDNVDKAGLKDELIDSDCVKIAQNHKDYNPCCIVSDNVKCQDVKQQSEKIRKPESDDSSDKYSDGKESKHTESNRSTNNKNEKQELDINDNHTKISSTVDNHIADAQEDKSSCTVDKNTEKSDIKEDKKEIPVKTQKPDDKKDVVIAGGSGVKSDGQSLPPNYKPTRPKAGFEGKRPQKKKEEKKEVFVKAQKPDDKKDAAIAGGSGVKSGGQSLPPNYKPTPPKAGFEGRRPQKKKGKKRKNLGREMMINNNNLNK